MDRDDALKIAAPIITMGALWITRKALAEGYSKGVGSAPPKPDDLDAPIIRVVLFAAATAAVIAVVERGLVRALAKPQRSRPLPD